MDLIPFTLDEASEIWDDFEDLKDTEFKWDALAEYLVHDVVVTPFGAKDKDGFIKAYNLTKDPQQSLEAYNGDEFDVVLVTSDVNDESVYTFFDIRTFATQKGIKYNFPA